MDADEAQFDKLSKSLDYYVYFYESIILVPIGIALNVITMIVYMNKRFSSSNFGFVMVVLVGFETLSLVTSIVLYKFLATINADPSQRSALLCFIWQYLMRSIQQIPAFIQIFISVYQYLQVSISSSGMTNILRNKRSIIIAIIMELALIALINIPNLNKKFAYTNSTVGNTTILTTSCHHQADLALLAGVETCLMRTLVPYGLIIVVNYKIANTLFRSKKRLASKSSSSSADFSKERNFAFCLFFENFLYFLFNFPASVTYVTVMVYTEDWWQQEIENLAHSMFNAFAMSFNAAPFFLSYGLNRAFRKTVKNFVVSNLGLTSENSSTNSRKNLARS